MNMEELRKRKMALGYTNERIAELSGVPLSTVQKVFAGVTQQPRYDTLMALERVLQPGNGRVCETMFSYKSGAETFDWSRQGQYTLEDYYNLPFDCRAELIDGVFHFLSAPSPRHQMILTAIWRLLDQHIRSNRGGCIPFLAPCDVQLEENVDNIYEPDIFVVCDRSKIHEQHIIGAPDLVVEILSPGTRRKDMVLKLNKYLEGGVREYWMVDPEHKKIIVYLSGDDLEMRIYGFSDSVPVGIFDGQCEIDFAEIYEEIRFLYQLEE